MLTSKDIASIQVRQATTSELPAIIELLPESTSGVMNAVLDDASLLQRLSNPVTHTGLRSCWVAAYDNTILGHAISFNDDAATQESNIRVDQLPPVLRPFRKLRTSGTWYLSSLAVAKDYRGQGIGRQLLKHTATLADTAGISAVSLHVFDHKLPAMRLYRSCGFKEVGRTVLPPHPKVRADGQLLLMVGDVRTILSE